MILVKCDCCKKTEALSAVQKDLNWAFARLTTGSGQEIATINICPTCNKFPKIDIPIYIFNDEKYEGEVSEEPAPGGCSKASFLS